jgi:hypothetical protein
VWLKWWAVQSSVQQKKKKSMFTYYRKMSLKHTSWFLTTNRLVKCQF